MSGRTARLICPTPGCVGGVRNVTGGLCLDCYQAKKASDAARRVIPSFEASVRSPSWEGAACVDADPDLFFPHHKEREGSSDARLREVEAGKWCTGCPVEATCLDYALKTKAVGFWGGTNDADRVAIRLRQGATG